MKKKIISILITIIVILFGVLAFILGVNTNLKHSKKDSVPVKTGKSVIKTTQTQQISQFSKEDNSVSIANDNLNTSNLTPKQVAALVAYHGSTLNNNNWQAWSNYEKAMDSGQSSTDEIFIVNQCPVQISQTGTGKIYSYTDQGGTLNFYTLSDSGNTVYIYACDSDSDDIQQPIETTTLQDMVNQANSNSMSAEIKNVANSINIKDCE